MIQAIRPLPNVAARKHLDALRISSDLTCLFRQMKQRNEAMITPQGVIDVLYHAGVNCVLIGTYGLGGWRDQPRATQDVDVLVRKNDVCKAVRTLHATYAELTIEDHPIVTRFVDPASGLPAIDLWKPNGSGLHFVFRHTIRVGKTHEIPELEMALACKFAAMKSPKREMAKKYLDMGDFMNVVMHNRTELDCPKLKRLGDKVYPNGGTEILQLVADIDAGRKIQI